MAVVGIEVKRLDSGEALRAIEWLKHLRDPSGTSAIDYLEQLKSSTAILTTYRRMFPSLYAASTSPLYGSDAKFPAHSPREAEFLKIIKARFFHLPTEDDVWYEEESETHYDEIPITPMQGDAWCCGDTDIEQFRSCFFVAAGLIHAGEIWETVAARYELDAGIFSPAPDVNYRWYEPVFAAEQSPLRYVPLAIDLMTYQTGNIFLDSSFCQPPVTIGWSAQNVRRVAKEYKEARLADLRMDELDRHIDTHHAEAVKRALELWNAAWRNQNNASSNSTGAAGA